MQTHREFVLPFFLPPDGEVVLRAGDSGEVIYFTGNPQGGFQKRPRRAVVSLGECKNARVTQRIGAHIFGCVRCLTQSLVQPAPPLG